MQITLNPSSIFYALNSVFGESNANQSPLNSVFLASGAFPASPVSDIASQILSGTGATGVYTAIPAYSWSVPSKGVCILLNGISIPIRTSGLPTDKVPSFVRIGNNNVGGMDAPIDVVKGASNFVVNSLNAVTAGSFVYLTDMRLKIKTQGPFSFNNTVANAILASWTGNQSATTGYGGNLMFGVPWVYKPDVSQLASPILVEAFDGAVPSSANDETTGTKLWSKSISGVGLSNVFTIGSNSIALQGDMSAAIIADGTPTYVRVTKAAITATASGYPSWSYPKMVIQAPVGNGVGYVSFDKTTFVTGQTATLNSFTMIFQPNLI